MTSPHERLDAAMEGRRLDLGMTWRDLANKARVSYEGLRAVRRGDRDPNALTRRRLEDAFRWQHGSIDTILNGGDPTPVDETPSEPEDTDIANLAARLERLEATAERQRQENAELRRMLQEITGEDDSNEGEPHRKAQ